MDWFDGLLKTLESHNKRIAKIERKINELISQLKTIIVQQKNKIRVIINQENNIFLKLQEIIVKQDKQMQKLEKSIEELQNHMGTRNIWNLKGVNYERYRK